MSCLFGSLCRASYRSLLSHVSGDTFHFSFRPHLLSLVILVAGMSLSPNITDVTQPLMHQQTFFSVTRHSRPHAQRSVLLLIHIFNSLNYKMLLLPPALYHATLAVSLTNARSETLYDPQSRFIFCESDKSLPAVPIPSSLLPSASGEVESIPGILKTIMVGSKG